MRLLSFLLGTGVVPLPWAILSIATASQQTCYWPNDEQAESDIVPCGNGMSQCCQIGSACLNNGLCFSPSDGLSYRGGCTSQNWIAANSTSCPTFCQNWNGGVGWAELNFCGQIGRIYWCDDPVTSPNRCAGTLYAWPAPLGGVAPNVGQILVVGSTSVSSGSTTTAPIASGSTPTSASNSITSTIALNSITSPPATGITSSSPAASSGNSSLPIAVGAAVGIPLGILVLCILGCLFLRERRKKRQAAGDTSMTLGGYSVDSRQELWKSAKVVAVKQEISGTALSELPEQSCGVETDHNYT